MWRVNVYKFLIMSLCDKCYKLSILPFWLLFAQFCPFWMKSTYFQIFGQKGQIRADKVWGGPSFPWTINSLSSKGPFADLQAEDSCGLRSSFDYISYILLYYDIYFSDRSENFFRGLLHLLLKICHNLLIGTGVKKWPGLKRSYFSWSCVDVAKVAKFLDR